MKLFHCSDLSELMTEAKGIAAEFRTPEVESLIAKRKRTQEEQELLDQLKAQSLADGTKTEIRKQVKQDRYQYKAFQGNKYTFKGNTLESLAIELSGKIRFRQYQKHVGRIENEFITGECDILDLKRRLIIDTKCSWDIISHPFFADEALEKSIKYGYDWQVQGYMYLYECDVAEIDFWLFPCPAELASPYDDLEQLITLVENIELRERLTTVQFIRDETKIQKIKNHIPHCQHYYEKLLAERSLRSNAA